MIISPSQVVDELLIFYQILVLFFLLLSFIIELDEDFVKSEIETFGKYLPSLADVIIHERDEYLAQTILELIRVGYGHPQTGLSPRKGNIVVVIGAGHLKGVQEGLQRGFASDERMRNISSSSIHNSTWPGAGYLQVVDTKILFPSIQQSRL